MDKAAGSSHLEMLQWLNVNRSEGCTTGAIDTAVENGHMEVVQWLHTNTTAGCTSHAMNTAAAYNNRNIVKWLTWNLPGSCLVQAIEIAVNNGHMRITYWLRAHFPQLSPANHASPHWVVKSFEILLFLHVNYPEVFTPEFIDEISREGETRPWLQDNYPLS